MIAEPWWIDEDAMVEAGLANAEGFRSNARQDQDTFQELVI